METIIKITPQWQFYIPQPIRTAIGLVHPTQARIIVQGKDLLLRLEESPLTKMAGKYHHIHQKKKIKLDNIRDSIDYSDL